MTVPSTPTGVPVSPSMPAPLVPASLSPGPTEPGGNDGQARLLTGLPILILGMMIIPGIDAIARYLAGEISPAQIALVRFAFQCLVLLPFVLLLPAARRRFDGHLWAHIARAFLLLSTTVIFFIAVQVMPIAEAIATFFVEPLILTVLSALFLGETIGWRRVAAVVVGLAGAMLIVRPGFDLFGWTAVLPLCAAVTFAFYMVLTRWLTAHSDPVFMQFTAGVFGTVMITAALVFSQLIGTDTSPVATTTGSLVSHPFALAWPSQEAWLLLGLLGAIATGGHLLIVFGLARVPASVAAPFQYLEIIGATTLGYLVFREFPDGLTWVGIALIVGAGLFVFYREQRRAKLNAA